MPGRLLAVAEPGPPLGGPATRLGTARAGLELGIKVRCMTWSNGWRNWKSEWSRRCRPSRKSFVNAGAIVTMPLIDMLFT